MGGGQLFPDTAIIFFFFAWERDNRAESSKQDDNSATNYINSLLLIVEILWDTTRFVFSCWLTYWVTLLRAFLSVKANGESRSTAGPAGRQAGRLAVTIRNDNNGASYLHRHVVAAAGRGVAMRFSFACTNRLEAQSWWLFKRKSEKW